LYKEIRYGKRKSGNYKDTRGSIINRGSMIERPSCVDTRERVGDLEVDLMM